jgi:glycosyltransferase involved in cell wall biosynthesis
MDSIEDLVAHLPQVKYVRLETKLPIGTKRNMTHALAKGDILVYMDDDDYYPPSRISHAVESLCNSNALCAGSSVIHVYFDHLQKVIEFGPYGPNHATAGTFAMKRALLAHTSYQETAEMSEERFFLKNYTIPMIQLDPMKTILVVSHLQNTFDKKTLLKPSPFIRETHLQLTDFVNEPLTLDFLKTVNQLIIGVKEL